MEGFDFSIDNLLTPEEAESFLKEQENDTPDTDETVEEEKGKESEPADGKDSQEKVGEDENTDEPEDDAVSDDGGSSPSVFSSIASALKEDGIFPDADDEVIKKVSTAEDFAELFEQAINARLDQRNKLIYDALTNGVEPNVIKQYEQTLQYLGSITDEMLGQEDEEGENLRRNLIYNDLVNRGYSQEKANRELEKSFKSGSDIEDAKDALESLNQFYVDGYKKIQDDAKQKTAERKEQQKRNAEKFQKMVLQDDIKVGDTNLDKKTRQKVYESVTKPVYKDPNTGEMLTAVQKFQREDPLEFSKQLGLWYVLTNGGKDISGLVKDQVRREKNKGIKDLERKINTTSFGLDGSLHYSGGAGPGGKEDLLLDPSWKIG